MNIEQIQLRMEENSSIKQQIQPICGAYTNTQDSIIVPCLFKRRQW